MEEEHSGHFFQGRCLESTSLNHSWRGDSGIGPKDRLVRSMEDSSPGTSGASGEAMGQM